MFSFSFPIFVYSTPPLKVGRFPCLTSPFVPVVSSPKGSSSLVLGVSSPKGSWVGTNDAALTGRVQYFKLQHDCQSSLKKTSEPIFTATLICTPYGRFQRLPHLAKACDDWDNIAHTTPSQNWTLFRRHFNDKMQQYKTRQQSLASAGIAQMVYTPEVPPALQSELESLCMKNATHQAHLANLIDQLQKQCLHPPLVPADTASVTNLALLSAISVISNTMMKVSSISVFSRSPFSREHTDVFSRE